MDKIDCVELVYFQNNKAIYQRLVCCKGSAGKVFEAIKYYVRNVGMISVWEDGKIVHSWHNPQMSDREHGRCAEALYCEGVIEEE